LLDEAIAEFREAIRIQKDQAASNDAVVRNRRELVYVNHPESMPATTENNDEAHVKLANALKKKGLLDEANAEYREAHRIKEPIHIIQGNRLQKEGKLDEAIAGYREAIRINKDFAEAHCDLGVALDRKGQLDEAIAELREAIRLKKDYAGAHNNLGVALYHKGHLDEAIAEYREAIRLKKDDPHAHSNLGGALYGKGQLDEAIAECREAIRIKKDSPEAHNNLGAALERKGHLDEAIAEFREAIRLKPDRASTHNTLAWLLATCPALKLRDPGQAVAHAKKAVELAPGAGMILNTLGVAQYRNGDWKAAVEALMKSVQLRKGGNSFDFFFLAMAHWQLDDKDKARAWYDQAVTWMDKNKPQDADLKRFRAEATALLGLAKAAQTQNKKD
jgi:Flp pilus assembly protein TadD